MPQQLLDSLVSELNKIKFPKKLRQNVNDNKYEYLIFHWTQRKFHSPSQATVNTKYPQIYAMLLKLIKQKDPKFTFSSIIINKNNVCKPHKDAYNIGDSYIIGVGDYTGGELVISQQKHDIHNKFLKFNGISNTHYNLDFEGTRYSIVYYTHKNIQSYLVANKPKLLMSKGLKFHYRKYTTDYKCFQEVILTNSYTRFGLSLKPTQTWLDLGGNIGTFAVLAGKQCKKVYSFEPEPDNFKLLKKNIKVNKLKNVQAFHSAVTQSGTQQQLYLRNGIYNKYQHTMIPSKKNHSINVNNAAFQDIISKYTDINCIKLDIEGSEMDILENNEFKNINIIVFEWSFRFDKSTERLQKVIEKLQKQGFEVKGSLKQIYSKKIWDVFPTGKLIYCIRAT